MLVILHLEHGLERFSAKCFSANLYEEQPGSWEFIVAVVTSEALQRSPKIAAVSREAAPEFEAAANVRQDIELVPGTVIEQKRGYDHQRDEHLSNFIYLSHNSVENLRIEILSVSEDWLELIVTGEAAIHGAKPDAKFAIRGRFQRDPGLERSIT